MGVGTTAVSAIRYKQKTSGSEIAQKHYDLALQRVQLEWNGRLPTRPMGQDVYQPSGREKVSQMPIDWTKQENCT